jgi:hypothetical protein
VKLNTDEVSEITVMTQVPLDLDAFFLFFANIGKINVHNISQMQNQCSFIQFSPV